MHWTWLCIADFLVGATDELCAVFTIVFLDTATAVGVGGGVPDGTMVRTLVLAVSAAHFEGWKGG